MAKILQHTLDNGLSIIIEPNSSVQSAALSWLVPAGVANDPVEKQGLAAMWAELLLRGAGERDSRAQADAFDMVGAGRSTRVSSRFLSLGTTVIGDRLAQAVPLLAEMVLMPRFEPDAIEPARDLAKAAIEALNDEPAQLAAMHAKARHFAPPFNRSTLGTLEGIASLTRADIVESWSRQVVPTGSILAVAGNIEPKAVIDQLAGLLCTWTGSVPEPVPAGEPARGYAHRTDETNQVQIVLLYDAPKANSENAMLERLTMAVLSGGMSARLFTEVREKRGLCYSVHASYSSDRDFGLVAAEVGTQPERAQESLVVLVDELLRITTPEGRVSPEEFARAVAGMKSRLIFHGESTAARASALAGDTFSRGAPRSLADVAAEIDAISLDQLNSYLATRTLGQVTVQTVGPAELTMPASLST